MLNEHRIQPLQAKGLVVLYYLFYIAEIDNYLRNCEDSERSVTVSAGVLAKPA